MTGGYESIAQLLLGRKSHVNGKEIAFAPLDTPSTIIGARTSTFGQLGVKAKKETLLPAFWAAFHPLALSHEFDRLIGFGQVSGFRLLFHLDYFLASLLGKKYTWSALKLDHTRISESSDLRKGPNSFGVAHYLV